MRARLYVLVVTLANQRSAVKTPVAVYGPVPRCQTFIPPLVKRLARAVAAASPTLTPSTVSPPVTVPPAVTLSVSVMVPPATVAPPAATLNPCATLRPSPEPVASTLAPERYRRASPPISTPPVGPVVGNASCGLIVAPPLAVSDPPIVAPPLAVSDPPIVAGPVSVRPSVVRPPETFSPPV